MKDALACLQTDEREITDDAGVGGCGLRQNQVYRRGCREACIDALTASVKPEADVRHGEEGLWDNTLWWSLT